MHHVEGSVPLATKLAGGAILIHLWAYIRGDALKANARELCMQGTFTCIALVLSANECVLL